MGAEHRRLTVAEFLAWSEEHPNLRAELIDGEIVAIAPELPSHGTAKGNAYVALRTAVREAGLACRVFVDSLGVQIDDDVWFIPDVVVECGSFVGPTERVLEPMIAVEVLSPSTRRNDERRKLRGYLGLPSLHHYLVIDPDDRTVVHHRRTDAGFVAEFPTETIVLDPPGVTLTVAALFEDA